MGKLGMIKENIREIVLDYLSVGIDPEKSSIFIQSQIPEIAELNLLFSMMVTLARVKRNPTVKDEMKSSGVKKVSIGFVSYPISQAADILSVMASYVPVGKDQLPHIELTREIASNFNRQFGNVFPIPEAILSKTPVLAGLDGQKMSKSRNNAIFLSDSAKIVEEKVMKAITDPKKIRLGDKGHPKVCNIYKYYEAFFPEKAKEIKEMCESGKIGCVECKKQMARLLNEFLDPIRSKREEFAKQDGLIESILEQGRKKTQEKTSKTLSLVKKAMGMDY